MPRPKTPRPTDAELDILQVLWKRGTSSVRDVQAALRETRRRDLGVTTVQKALEIMDAKGLVKKDVSLRRATYSAAIAQDAVESLFLRHLAERVFGRSLTRLVMRSLPMYRASRDELDDLKRHLSELEAGGKQTKPRADERTPRPRRDQKP